MIFEKGLNSEAFTLNGNSLSVQSQKIRIKHRLGEFIWLRPTAILVEREGLIRRIPILDVTRIVLLTLWSLTIIFLFVGITGFQRSKGG